MKRRRPIVCFVGLVALFALAVVPIASAHQAGLIASLDCNGNVSWTVSGNGYAGTFTVSDSTLGPVGSGSLIASDFSSSGSYAISTALASTTVSANVIWGDAFVGGQPGPITVNRPTNCVPPRGACHETVNPAGKPAVGDNGFPNDPFGGDAVPGGKSTSPGTNGHGPINSDGFYLVSGYLFSDSTAIPYPGGGLLWPNDTTIKYTEWGNKQIKITSSIGGPKSAIQYHVQAPGDLYVGAPKGDPSAIFCGVPPPPF